MEILAIIDKVLALKPVRWLMLLLAMLLTVLVVYLGLRTKYLSTKIKVIEKDLAWVQQALSLQNDAVRKAGDDLKRMEKQAVIKAGEAQEAKVEAQIKAEEILRLKMSTDCKEVAAWGIKQSVQQSRW